MFRLWQHRRFAIVFALVSWFQTLASQADPVDPRPHIILVMTDDQGWGETSYNHHPILKTPELDAMAVGGLRFNRFYAGAPVCSPTRATVLTGRTNDRTGAFSYGYALRHQEITIATLLRQAGYTTSHFGKWHLNGMHGPGVPIFANDSHHPGTFGFTNWLSVTNYFDRNPILSRQGSFEEHRGDSSEIVVDQALQFLSSNLAAKSPTFTVIWFGTPHVPFKAAESDLAAFESLDPESQHHYGELVAMDRSIGSLRRGLRKLGIAKNTLLWFCSDNGGLKRVKPTTVGTLRGYKSSVYEGGIRVPAMIEWPAQISPGSQSNSPAFAGDILPTLLAITGIEYPDADRPTDGISLTDLWIRQPPSDGAPSLDRMRPRPIYFRYRAATALIDNDWKLLSHDWRDDQWELYNIARDSSESVNLIDRERDVVRRMHRQWNRWNESVEASMAGKDYPTGKVDEDHPEPRYWTDVESYQPYLNRWRQRWPYDRFIQRREK